MTSHLRKITTLGIVAFFVAGSAGIAHAQSGDETSGDETSGDETSGDETSGDETSGDETSGDDTASTERARELFQEGLVFSDRGEWGEAAQRFEAALALRDAPTIRYNLGTSLLSLERLVEAAVHLDQARSHPEATPELVAQAEEQLATLEPLISRLEIVIEGFEQPPRVVFDGTLLDPEQLDRPMWVEPGHHVASAEQDGDEVARAEVDLLAGSLENITLRNVPREAVTPVDDGHDDERTPLVRDWRLWVGVGGGVVALALAFGLGFGLSRDSGAEDPIVGTMEPGVIEWP